mgnify:CR=1 FL=1
MPAKDVKRLIVTLIILIIGINLLVYLVKNYILNVPQAGLDVLGTADITPALTTLSGVLSVGLAFLVLILIPVYLSKRSQEKYTSP